MSIKFSDFTQSASVNGTEQLVGIKSGNNGRFPFSQVVTYLKTIFASLTGANGVDGTSGDATLPTDGQSFTITTGDGGSFTEDGNVDGNQMAGNGGGYTIYLGKGGQDPSGNGGAGSGGAVVVLSSDSPANQKTIIDGYGNIRANTLLVSSLSMTSFTLVAADNPGSSSSFTYRSNGFFAFGGGCAFTVNMPTALSANADNYNIGGYRTVKVRASTPVNITGINVLWDGRELRLCNAGSNNITLKHQSASSTATCRFLFATGNDIVLFPGQSLDFWYDSLVGFWRDVSDQTLTLSGAATGSGNGAITLSQVIAGSVYQSVPANGTLVLSAKAAFGFTINQLRGIKTSAGTLTVAVQINGTNVTGLSAVSVTSSAQDVNATAANVVAAGDRVTLVISSVSSAADLELTLKGTR